MTATVASFQADFPEFVNATTGKITFWLNVASNLVDPVAWDTLTDSGVELLTAHYVSLDMREAATAAAGGIPGGAAGVLTTKGAGGITAGYDVASSTVDKAGDLNLTSYGKRFAALRRLFGAGGIQLGIGAPDGEGIGYAWYQGPPFPGL